MGPKVITFCPWSPSGPLDPPGPWVPVRPAAPSTPRGPVGPGVPGGPCVSTHAHTHTHRGLKVSRRTGSRGDAVCLGESVCRSHPFTLLSLTPFAPQHSVESTVPLKVRERQPHCASGPPTTGTPRPLKGVLSPGQPQPHVQYLGADQSLLPRAPSGPCGAGVPLQAESGLQHVMERVMLTWSL